MPLYVPDGTKLYEADEDNLILHARGNSIVSGCGVTAQGAPNMTVQIAAGTLQYNGAIVTVASVASLAVNAADPSNPRIDLVAVNGTTGVVTITAGTAAATPKPPSLPAGLILLAYVSVAAAAVNIQNSNISDRRLIPTVGQGIAVGTLATRPGAAVQTGMYYFATDDTGGTLYRSNGATWVQVSPGVSAAAVSMPNLCLNSDFGRRNVFGLAMPETFADTSGYTKLDGGAAPTVSGNTLTFGAANNDITWCGGSFVWRDGRMSVQFKAVNVLGFFQLRWRIDASNFVEVSNGLGGANFSLRKFIAGVGTTGPQVAHALTLNNWYWLEIEKQGTTFVGKIYNSGAAPAAKSAATLDSTQVWTVADTQVSTGATLEFTADQATTAVGGMAASPGGVYVETWLPESWAVSFGGTLGGQAVAFNEVADAGPLGKQWSLKTYIPATSRTITIAQSNTARGNFAATTPVASSIYYKTTSASGAGLLTFYTVGVDGSGADVDTSHTLIDAAATAWTRLTQTFTTGGTTRGFRFSINVNNGVNQSGTLEFMLPQVEQGSSATAWRNAPADDDPIVWELSMTRAVTTTSATFASIEDRDLAADVFLPWDARVKVHVSLYWSNSGANFNLAQANVDGSAILPTAGFGHYRETMVAGAVAGAAFEKTASLVAGKHRVKADFATSAGTATVDGTTVAPVLVITATRGK